METESQLVIVLCHVLVVLCDTHLRYTEKCKEVPCSGGRYYHCLLDSTGRLGEWCLDKRLMIESMQCPYYNLNGQTGNLDTRRCSNMYSNGCPQEAYYSDRSFNYSDCIEKEDISITTPQVTSLYTTVFYTTRMHQEGLGKIPTLIQKKDHVNAPQSHSQIKEDDDTPILIIVLPVVVAALIVLIIIIVVIWTIRRRRPPPNGPRDAERILNRPSESVYSEVSDCVNGNVPCTSRSLLPTCH